MTAERYDMVVVGAGMAGAAMALAVSHLPIRIAVLEARRPPVGWPPCEESVADYDTRVSAITEASRALLERLQVWSQVADRRSCAYSDMDVWDGEGTGHIHFSAADVHRAELGHIVENRLITAALLNRLQEQGRVNCLFGVALDAIEVADGGTELVMADGRRLFADLLVAADGANSRVRQLAGFQTREWDYHHQAIVATVETQLSHANTAWQRFLPEGPLAFLPLADAVGAGHFSSIVWSALPDFAGQLLAMDDAEFLKALTQHFEGRLGEVVAVGPRQSFPLRQRHAVNYVRGRVVLVGDAAHSIHPLAGQGINLGFADVKALAEELSASHAARGMLADESALARYQRRRKGENLAMMAAMEGFQHLFESTRMPLRIARNLGMNVLDRLAPLKQQIISRAMGL